MNTSNSNKPAECTIVMYHYVRDVHKTEYPKLKALPIKKFIGQLNYILKNYACIRLEDYLSYLSGERSIPKKCCILSFDDGLKEHYQNVLPLLKKRGLPAVFFPITQPLVEQRLPAVHKTHFLLAKIGSKKFADEFNQALQERFPELAEKFLIEDKIKKEKQYRWDEKYRWDGPLTSSLKYVLTTMPQNNKLSILDWIFKRYFNEKKLCQKLYMNFAEMKEAVRQGISFGGHSHSHPMLCELTSQEQKTEIRRSKAILEKGLGAKINVFAYPYGGFSQITTALLKKEGYLAGLTTDFGVNCGRKINPFTLKRIDTNDLPLN